MKQQIFIPRNSISEKAWKRLVKWGGKHNYNFIRAWNSSDPLDVSCLLNIAQMIEYLDENRGARLNAPWEVLVINKDTFLKDNELKFRDCLKWCDALWGAVKEVLEK